MKVSDLTLNALKPFITGDGSPSPYMSGPELVKFFNVFGAKDEYLRIDYIQAPILFKYRITDKLLVGAGPLVGVKIWEYEDGFTNFGFSAVGSLEFMITDMFFIDARYHYGLTNVLDDNAAGYEAKNSNIQLGFGIKI